MQPDEQAINAKANKEAMEREEYLSGWRFTNWHCEDADQPITINRNASTHACIAWCWGEADEALEVAISAAAVDESNLRALMEAMQGRLIGIKAMLHHLAERTRPPRGGAA